MPLLCCGISKVPASFPGQIFFNCAPLVFRHRWQIKRIEKPKLFCLHINALPQNYEVLAGATVGVALRGHPLVKTRSFTRGRVATEGHPYSCALKNLTLEAKPHIKVTQLSVALLSIDTDHLCVTVIGRRQCLVCSEFVPALRRVQTSQYTCSRCSYYQEPKVQVQTSARAQGQIQAIGLI